MPAMSSYFALCRSRSRAAKSMPPGKSTVDAASGRLTTTKARLPKSRRLLLPRCCKAGPRSTSVQRREWETPKNYNVVTAAAVPPTSRRLPGRLAQSAGDQRLSLLVRSCGLSPDDLEPAEGCQRITPILLQDPRLQKSHDTLSPSGTTLSLVAGCPIPLRHLPYHDPPAALPLLIRPS